MYVSAAQMAKRWGISERTVRNYCANGKIEGAFLAGKTWQIPHDAQRPLRKNASAASRISLLETLQDQKTSGVKGGIYHKVQIELTYNSNHMEGSRLTHEQTRLIFETNTIGIEQSTVNVDDIIEAANHFRCIDAIIENAKNRLSESFIKKLHATLKSGTSDARKEWFAVGDYKRLPNEVGGMPTAAPEEVGALLHNLISDYNTKQNASFEEIVAFHVAFERIHPFQDGNGRVGRLILFKECLRNGVVPFIIDEPLKMFYYRGLSEWDNEPGYLLDTCRAGQDKFKAYLDYFRIPYEK